MSTRSDSIDWQDIKERIASVERVIQGRESRADCDEVLARRAERYRKVEERQSANTVDLVVFRRLDDTYAVSLEALEEIRMAQNLTPLPGVKPAIRGIINVRGHIVAVHDLASVDTKDAAMPDIPWVVIGRGGDTSLAIVADEVHGVIRPVEKSIRPVPLSMKGRDTGFQGVLDDGTLILDFDGLLRSEEFFLA